MTPSELIKMVLALPIGTKEWAVDHDTLVDATEIMRQTALEQKCPLYFRVEGKLAQIVTLDKPLPPLDGLMVIGISLVLQDD